MKNIKIPATLFVVLIIGYIEWIIIPIVLNPDKNLFSVSNTTNCISNIGFGILIITLPILGYCIIKKIPNKHQE